MAFTFAPISAIGSSDDWQYRMCAVNFYDNSTSNDAFAVAFLIAMTVGLDIAVTDAIELVIS